MITLKILEPISAIEKRVNSAFSKEINRFFNQNKAKVLNQLRLATKTWIIQQPEIQSLRQFVTPGELSSLFGIPVRENRKIVDVVIEAIANCVFVKVDRIDNNLKGKIEFYFQFANFSHLLSLPEGFTITSKNEQLHWMNWLLTQGSQTIVYGYTYVPGIGLGRSGGGKMKQGGVFRVPPQYSGTVDDNFVTRAFQNKEKEIANIIERLFK